MAGLTKEQRAEKAMQEKAEMEARIRAEIEENIRAEYEQKFAKASVNAASNVPNPKNQRAKRIPLDIIVPVVCNTIGGAVYIARNGDRVEWDEYGSREYMVLSDLVSMKNSQRRFFEDNWIILEDADDYTAFELYEFLKVSKYYENIITIESLDSIMEMDEASIIRALSGLSDGMKSTIASMVKPKVDAKELSGKTIEAFETGLNVKFSIH